MKTPCSLDAKSKNLGISLGKDGKYRIGGQSSGRATALKRQKNYVLISLSPCRAMERAVIGAIYCWPPDAISPKLTSMPRRCRPSNSSNGPGRRPLLPVQHPRPPD